MVNNKQLQQIGCRLRESDIKTLSITDLYSILRRVTGVQSPEPLKRYAQILKKDGYISFNQNGLWEINR